MDDKISLWWVTTPGLESPVGPVTGDLLRRGIAAGRVPEEALVCRVGAREWRPFAEIDDFRTMLTEFDLESERVHFDLRPLPAEDAQSTEP